MWRRQPKYARALLVKSVSYTGIADKSVAQPTYRCILFDGENISFDASLVVCVCVYIQGVPGGMCQTSGECSLS